MCVSKVRAWFPKGLSPVSENRRQGRVRRASYPWACSPAKSNVIPSQKMTRRPLWLVVVDEVLCSCFEHLSVLWTDGPSPVAVQLGVPEILHDFLLFVLTHSSP